MKIESIAAFCNTFDMHSAIISPENQILVLFLSGSLRHGLHACICIYIYTYIHIYSLILQTIVIHNVDFKTKTLS